ncbi:MAG: hypothetical protein QGM50_09880 [Anaerolineae bacterium]|nr:hypothetical protein [Anaerolineae bacterium]
MVTSTVMNWVKEHAENLPDAPVLEGVYTVEMDELWSLPYKRYKRKIIYRISNPFVLVQTFSQKICFNHILKQCISLWSLINGS